MRILLLGATGRTGRHILEQALENQMEVVVVVRDAKKLAVQQHPSLVIWEGDVDNADLIKKAITGCHVVISGLNVSRKNDLPWAPLVTPVDLMSRTTSQLLPIAQQAGVEQLIVLSACGVGDSISITPAWFRWVMRNTNVRFPYADHEKQEKLITNSNLNYTIIRPVALSDQPKNLPVIVSEENKPKPRFMYLPRTALATFVLAIVGTDKYSRKTIVVSA